MRIWSFFFYFRFLLPNYAESIRSLRTHTHNWWPHWMHLRALKCERNFLHINFQMPSEVKPKVIKRRNKNRTYYEYWVSYSLRPGKGDMCFRFFFLFSSEPRSDHRIWFRLPRMNVFHATGLIMLWVYICFTFASENKLRSRITDSLSHSALQYWNATQSIEISTSRITSIESKCRSNGRLMLNRKVMEKRT